MHDVHTLETLGVPSVGIATTAFAKQVWSFLLAVTPTYTDRHLPY